MKGFIFSTEAFFSIAILIAAIGLVQFETSNIQTQDNALNLQEQNKELTTLYFNYSQSVSDSNNTNQYCTKIEKYSKTTKSFIDTSVCRGTK